MIAAEIARIERVMNDWLVEGRLDADTEELMLAELEELRSELIEE